MAGPEPPRPPDEPTRPTEPLRPVPPRQPVPSRQPPYAQQGYVQPGYEGYPPEPPPADPWWGSPGAAFAAGLVGVLLGAVVGYLIGHGNTTTKTVASGPPATRTVTSTKTVPTVTTVTEKTVTQKPADEERRVEAEEQVKTLEKENEELRKAEGG